MNYFIIDGMNYCHRMHNVNYELRTAKGMPSGMFYGFIRGILALKKKYRGYQFCVAWDNRAYHKFELQPDYKSGRTQLPPIVMSQVDDLKEYLKNCNVNQYEKEGQEADDVIASLVEMFRDDGDTIMIYTNDKDMLQLVETGKVVVYKPKVAGVPDRFYDEDAVVEVFGVPPKKLAYYRSFDGDASDHITGVPRVPRKLLASLVNQYGSPANVYQIIDANQIKLTAYQQRAFVESEDRVRTNLKIVELDRGITDIDCQKGVCNQEALVDILHKYEVKSVDPVTVIDIFSSSLNMKYTEARSPYKLESFSLFGE